MSYGVSVAWQVSNFFMSMGLGFLVGFLYSLSLALILVFGASKAVYIIFDLIFSITSTMLFFCYSLIYCQGESRLISVLAMFIGALVFHFTIGKFINKFSSALARGINKLVRLILSPLTFSLKFLKNKGVVLFKKLKLDSDKLKTKFNEQRKEYKTKRAKKESKGEKQKTNVHQNKKNIIKRPPFQNQTHKKSTTLLDKIHKNSKKSKKVLQNEQNLI